MAIQLIILNYIYLAFVLFCQEHYTSSHQLSINLPENHNFPIADNQYSQFTKILKSIHFP